MSTTLQNVLDKNNFILMEGAVVEILRRSCNIDLHPSLIHAHLIYDQEGVNALTSIFKSYIEIAQKADLPFIMFSPTWRANKENVIQSKTKESINIDAIKFMQKLRSEFNDFSNKILIGGTIGPKNDCYTPSEGLSEVESENFHAWQIEQLIDGGADFIIAETIPNIKEAIGMSKAAAKLNAPYIISFVISRDGKILDGSNLLEATKEIDNNVIAPPIGYMVNCAHPIFLCADQQPKELFERLIGYLGNASSLDHCNLENADNLHSDNSSEWGNEMLKLNHNFGIKILGGCCGTNSHHIEYLVKNK